MIAGRKARDSGSDSLDDSCTLVSEYDWAGRETFDQCDLKVSMTDTTGDYADKDFIGARFIYRDGLDLHGKRVSAQNGSVCYHQVTPRAGVARVSLSSNLQRLPSP